MNILLTAFEPFGNNSTNITKEVLHNLPKQVGTHHLHKVVLPVSFIHAPALLKATIEQQQPDCVLMLGQCAQGNNIRLERFAINMMDSGQADNDCYTPHEIPIYLGQPLALKTAFSVRSIVALLQQQGLPAVISNSAGLYVCNRVYYEALHEKQNALFVHIPKNMDTYLTTQTLSFLVQNLPNLK